MSTAEAIVQRNVKLQGTRRTKLLSLLTIASLSLLLVLPCIWQPHIESTDLATHVYNAWIARLITTEHLPGLWINHQVTNVVFDYLLTWLLGTLGPLAAERIAASIAVLVFFWGAFFFISEAGGRRPWFLLPGLAVVAYGRVFYLGFFNFYLSVGFSLIALACLWKPTPLRSVLAAGATLVACCCHPLGAAWAVLTALYLCLVRNSSRKVQAALFSASVLALAGIGLFQHIRFPTAPTGFGERVRQLVSALGWDQVLPFTRPFSVMSYRFVELGLIAILGSLAFPLLVEQKQLRTSLPVQLYALAAFALLFLPQTFHLTVLFPTQVEAFIGDRLSLIAAVLACSVVAGARPRKWQRAILIGLAALYFGLIYQDQRTLNQIEVKVTRLVRQLPPRQRVTAFLPYQGVALQTNINSIVDRACVEHCYSYGNYEPSSRQFRIRAARDNAFVLWSARDVFKLQRGSYTVQARDLPLYQIYWCGPAANDPCIRPLAAGEINGQLTKVPIEPSPH